MENDSQETYSSVKGNSRSAYLTHSPLFLLSCYTAKTTTNKPRICGFSSVWVWKNNNLACGVKEKLYPLSQTSRSFS